MNRRLCFVFLAAGLIAACTTTPQHETEALAAEILGGSSLNGKCVAGEVQQCETNGSRIQSSKRNLHCDCTPRELIIEDRYQR